MSAKTVAFGIEPGRRARYRLRLAKYYAIGEFIGQWARDLSHHCPAPAIIDVGGDEGRVFRYIEAFLGEEKFRGTIVDLFPKGTDRVYQKERRELVRTDLNFGLPMFGPATFDIAICEQVLEHLVHPEILVAEMHRILKPGGLGIFGVPSFPPGFPWIRGHVVKWIDRRATRTRGHIRAFSLNSFSQMVARCGPWQFLAKRGFRFVSGGPLRPLENHRWWWLCNRWLGAQLPSLCIEVQLVVRKTLDPPLAP